MVEWSITAVLKTAVLRGTGGSNPSLSAINLDNQGFANIVHEYVHETSHFSRFGTFFRAKTPSFVYTNKKAPTMKAGATLYHNFQPCGFATMLCKDRSFL